MTRIDDGMSKLRAAGAVLERKWRDKPKGDILRWHLADVERKRSAAAVEALIEFLVRMQLVADSPLLGDVLDAAEAMITPPKIQMVTMARPGGYFNIGPGLQVQELTAEEAAEIAALGPQHGDGDDCEICRVLARQRRDREARASSSGN